MNDYKSILIIHSVDNSTQFLAEFKNHFGEYYRSFDKNGSDAVKYLLGDLEMKSLIMYLGHGSSNGIYEPSDDDNYENYFLDITWGNHYFEGHDLILLSCNSSEYIRKMHKYSRAIGFGNIISSQKEVKVYNSASEIEKKLDGGEINRFNSYYVDSLIKCLHLLLSQKIQFSEIVKQLEFFLNRHISTVLKEKTNENRVELARLLFEFRDEALYKTSDT